MEYTDVLTGQADDLQLTLEDRDGLWLEAWFPDKGAALTASILTNIGPLRQMQKRAATGNV